MLALSYYSRMRFISSLLPLLSHSPSARVITVLAAGLESTILIEDLDLSSPGNYSMLKCMNHSATMTSLALDELAKSNPSITFIHKYPGPVKTGLLDRMFSDWTGIWSVPAFVVRWCILPVAGFFLVSVEESGERGLYISTAERFRGGGFYRLDQNDENAKQVEVYEKYKADGMGKKIWEHTVMVYERILSRT
jgi:hypothetical protein